MGMTGFFTPAERQQRADRLNAAIAWMATQFGHSDRDAFLRAQAAAGAGPMVLDALLSHGYLVQHRNSDAIELTPYGYQRERAVADPLTFALAREGLRP